MPLQFHPSLGQSFLPADWLSSRHEALSCAQSQLETRSGLGAAFSGWLDLPTSTNMAELSRMKAVAASIRAQSDALVVIGIGGSYLGARAVLELLRSPQHNLIDKPQIFFAGSSLSSDELSDLMKLLRERDFSLLVISKSGTTTETAVAFSLLRQLLHERYEKDEARRRLFVITDAEEGSLRALVRSEGLAGFAIPQDVGGRYSVLSPVGLLPLAVAGVDIDKLLSGAAQMRTKLQKPGEENPAWQYAAAREALLSLGLQVELLVAYHPYCHFFGEWWKQLFGESQGKDGRGLFPATAEFCADLHAMGQYIQQGPRVLFETLLVFDEERSKLQLPEGEGSDTPPLLRGRSLAALTDTALRATLIAHIDGGVPNLLIRLRERSAESIGALIYFFEYACALGGYLVGLNPFDQPGVEDYKRNMRALLGEEGLDETRAALSGRL